MFQNLAYCAHYIRLRGALQHFNCSNVDFGRNLRNRVAIRVLRNRVAIYTLYMTRTADQISHIFDSAFFSLV